MFGPGSTFYHPLYVDNLVDAFELAAASERGSGEAYLIADDRYVTLDELVRAVGRAIGVEVAIRHVPFWPLWTAALACEVAFWALPADPPLFRRRVDWFRQNRAFDIGRARRELGYRPAVGLDQGLARTAEWYRREGYLPSSRGSAVPAGRAAS
jgi:nucleoside-diphosphate-sugar epimerase